MLCYVCVPYEHTCLQDENVSLIRPVQLKLCQHILFPACRFFSLAESIPGCHGRCEADLPLFPYQYPQMAPRAIDGIISGEIKSLKQMRPHASNVVEWLKENLPRAHDDQALKKRIKLLLGAPRFAPNLAHLGL